MTYQKLFSFAAVLVLGSASLYGLAAEPAPGGLPPDNAPRARQAANAAPTALRYQLALDQLALGDIASARVLAQSAQQSYGDSPEVNMLLAWLLQREGRLPEAAQALEAVSQASPLAAAQLLNLAQPGTAAAAGALPTGTVTTAASPAAATPAAAKTKTPASLAQPDARLRALENHMVNRVNAERRKAGLAALITDSRLADTSRAHSAEMRDRRYFAHESPTPGLREPLDRYRAVFKATPSIVAENIYRSWGSQRRITEKDIDAGHAALMKSPGHRSNILMKDVRRLGIGIVANSNGDFWITQMFARN